MNRGQTTVDRRWLRAAARLAVRGHGAAEPNPLVGCIIVADGAAVGRGHHRRFGEDHAEIVALREAGPRARGATVYATLEPCAHQGQTGPCTAALIDAGVRRVVIAAPDPNPPAAGGAEVLKAAGIEVEVVSCPEAEAVSRPFRRRIETGRPWVIAKWAQTVDGRLATRSGASKWITGPRARGLVHRQRGRVDAVLTGIGTVLADDPRLNARARRRRRISRRVVFDPKLETPPDAALLDLADGPTTIAVAEPRDVERIDTLRSQGVEVVQLPPSGRPGQLQHLLEHLTETHAATTVWVEAGGGLLTQLFDANLVDEAWVFVGPRLLGDETAPAPLRGRTPGRLEDALDLELYAVHRLGPDVLMRYWVRGNCEAVPARAVEQETS